MKKITRMLLPAIFVFSLNPVSAQVDSSLILIKQVKLRLNEGADFCEIARIYSEDTQSKLNCGDIGYFGLGELMRGYEDAMVKLKVGQISDIVQTGYGYHIIQLVGVEKKKYATRHVLIRYR